MNAVEIDSWPDSQVHNSQPHGIGRVVGLDGIGAWSNLGRNVVFVGPDLRPRAIFDESVFDEDEPSQYDLDVHAILDLPDAGLVLTMNHYGMVRAFRSIDVRADGAARRVAPLWMRTFTADVERAVVVDGRLVGSRPREERAAGLLVSEPLGLDVTTADLDIARQLDTWAMTTALTPLDDNAVAVGGGTAVGIVELDGRYRWCADVDFEPAFLAWDGALLWAAGSEADAMVDDYDWDARHGGGFAALDPGDGRVVVEGRFTEDLAWGNGGVALALVPGALCGFGRRGQVYVFDRRDGAPMAVTPPTAEMSLGIGHGAAIGDRLVFGYNRGGYRLWALP
ncbi:MAG TPA: hypothetical protein VKD67_07730 [Acidimicrobiales bacterium]|nr:hypothetical protein [Acidimicrobiales bacterium]